MKLVLNSAQQIFIERGTVLSENCAHCCSKGDLVQRKTQMYLKWAT